MSAISAPRIHEASHVLPAPEFPFEKIDRRHQHCHRATACHVKLLHDLPDKRQSDHPYAGAGQCRSAFHRQRSCGRNRPACGCGARDGRRCRPRPRGGLSRSQECHRCAEGQSRTEHLCLWQLVCRSARRVRRPERRVHRQWRVRRQQEGRTCSLLDQKQGRQHRL
ncbi:hypothetical protein D3C80_879050 [compost metagenome]